VNNRDTNERNGPSLQKQFNGLVFLYSNLYQTHWLEEILADSKSLMIEKIAASSVLLKRNKRKKKS